jgi:UDP-N-acetylmuramate dehydrogenase
MHANYFVNLGEGRAADVTTLMRRARDEVRQRWGVELLPEVKLLGAAGRVVRLDP